MKKRLVISAFIMIMISVLVASMMDCAAITSPGNTTITSGVTGKFVKMSTAVTGADYYLEIGFTIAAGSLAARGTAEFWILPIHNIVSRHSPGYFY